VRPVVFPAAQLQCTASGQVLGDRPDARFVYHENQARLQALAARPAPSHDAGLAWLRRRVMGPRQPGELNPRYMPPETCGAVAVAAAFWWSQPGLLNHGLLCRPARLAGRDLPVTLAVWDDGTTALAAHWSWLQRQCRQGRAVLVLDVAGVGALLPNPLNPYAQQDCYGVLHKLADDLLWLGDDLAALRTFDVTRALDVLAQWPGLAAGPVAGYAHGRQGVHLQLAAALDARLAPPAVHEGLGSYAQLGRTRLYPARDIKSVLIHGLLRHLDLDALPRS
jgi:hypothetical protein